MTKSGKILTLIAGDVIALYAALFLALIARYRAGFYERLIHAHIFPFTLVFGLWIAVFLIAGLYDFRFLRNNLDFLKMLGLAFLVNAVLTILFFYFIPVFGITPKTNLFLFLIIFAFLELLWRRFFNRYLISGKSFYNLILIGKDEMTKKIHKHLADNPQLGYLVKNWLPENESEKLIGDLENLTKENGVNLIVVPAHIKKNNSLNAVLYRLLNQGVEILEISNFYEILFQAIPLENLEEVWFLENITKLNPGYEFIKRGMDIFFSLIIFIITLPLWIPIAFLIKLTSAGPVIFRQTRIGKNKKEFILYKFRTMKTGSQHLWPEENDSRITAIGKFLRLTHLDELPQLINIFKGNISLVGPRPDFVDFFKKLVKEIPYYEIRTFIRPGLTGWAQINYPITASLEQTKERLGYDFYYLKHRSLALDMAIIVKTIKVLLTAKGR